MLVFCCYARRVEAHERIGANVRRLREAAGLTQAELATALSEEGGAAFYPQTITKIEAGRRALKFSEGLAIARVLGVTPASLDEGIDGDYLLGLRTRAEQELQRREWSLERDRKLLRESELAVDAIDLLHDVATGNESRQWTVSGSPARLIELALSPTEDDELATVRGIAAALGIALPHPREIDAAVRAWVEDPRDDASPPEGIEALRSVGWRQYGFVKGGRGMGPRALKPLTDGEALGHFYLRVIQRLENSGVVHFMEAPGGAEMVVSAVHVEHPEAP